MKLFTLLVVSFFAVVASQSLASELCSLGNDLDIGASFVGTESLSLQFVSITNLHSGEGFTNALNNVSFSISSLSVFPSYGNGQRNGPVGTILAGVTGWGQFYSFAGAGPHSLFISVSYRLGNSNAWRFACKEFSFSNSFKRSVEDFSVSDSSAERGLEVRTSDVSINPTSFIGEDSTTVWNDFDVTANTNVKNVSWSVVPNDLSIGIGYPGNGNYLGSISNGNTDYTSFSVTGNGGSYTCNCTVQYKKSSTGNTWQYYSVAYPLTIAGGGGTSSVKRIASDILNSKQREVVSTEAQANGVQYVRADYALGIAVAGIAAVAAVAVVGAMVLIRRRSTYTSA